MRIKFSNSTKKRKFSKSFKVIALVFILLIIASSIAYAVNNWDQGYKVPQQFSPTFVPGSSAYQYLLDVGGTDIPLDGYVMSYQSTYQYFVPTKTQEEWDSFYNNLPPCIHACPSTVTYGCFDNIARKSTTSLRLSGGMAPECTAGSCTCPTNANAVACGYSMANACSGNPVCPDTLGTNCPSPTYPSCYQSLKKCGKCRTSGLFEGCGIKGHQLDFADGSYVCARCCTNADCPSNVCNADYTCAPVVSGGTGGTGDSGTTGTTTTSPSGVICEDSRTICIGSQGQCSDGSTVRGTKDCSACIETCPTPADNPCGFPYTDSMVCSGTKYCPGGTGSQCSGSLTCSGGTCVSSSVSAGTQPTDTLEPGTIEDESGFTNPNVGYGSEVITPDFEEGTIEN